MGNVLLLKSLCYSEHVTMLRLLKWSFSLFCLAVLFALFDMAALFSLLNLVIAFIIFYGRYYRLDAVI